MNLLLIIGGIALLALLQLGAGIYSFAQLVKAYGSEPDWRKVIWLSALTAMLFSAGIAFWIVMLFEPSRSHAPMLVLNGPAWILFLIYIGGELFVRLSEKSSLLYAWEGIGLAVPASSIFAVMHYDLLSQIFGPIKFH
jgi:hypothetical protein